MKEVWYVWRVLARVEGEETKRLLVPWADPQVYEFPFDFMFETPEAARQGLIDWGAEEDARLEGWVLCKMTLEDVRGEES